MAVLSGCRRQPQSARVEPAFAADSARPCSSVVDVCVGAAHSCARFDDGKIACWGDNRTHAIAASGSRVDEPRVFAEFGQAQALRCAESATCALMAGGSIACRGEPYGEVTTLRLPGRAKDFAPNGAGGCAILEDARVACWQGAGEILVVVDAAAGATGFAVSPVDSDRVCVARASFGPVCFDAVLAGPVPEGARPPFPPPAARQIETLEDLAGARALVSAAAMCGVWADGSTRCRSDGPLARALAVTRVADFVAANRRSVCARLVGGPIRCFATSLLLPGEVPPGPDGVPEGASQLALSDGRACALSRGQVLCWTGDARDGGFSGEPAVVVLR